jgi:pimeloyl-ACP methyl ester carboxylesterase
LEYIVEGSGEEPVVFIHGNIIADANAPLLKQQILADSYRLVSYHRRGYAGSESCKTDLPPTISRQASECRSAHLVGHSHGGVIALQLALDHPTSICTLSLLEPALVAFIPQAKVIQEKFVHIVQAYDREDKTGSIDEMLQIIGEYRNMTERVLPGSFDQAVVDADSLFKIDMPAMRSWSIRREDVRRINVPIVSVLGSDSQPMFKETCEVVRQWFPKSEMLLVQNATHWLQLTNPTGLAEGLVKFFKKHSIKNL